MKKLFKALLNYFIKGLLIVVPLGAAFLLIFWAVKGIDNALNLSGILVTTIPNQANLCTYPAWGL